MKKKQSPFADLVTGTLREGDPEAFLSDLLDTSGVSIQEFYTFAHYIRRVAWAKASRLINDDEEELRCSFCLRTREEAGTMVQGSAASICDRCIEDSLNTVKAERPK